MHEFGHDGVSDKKNYKKESKVVYTFKTRHCTEHPCVPGETDPVYAEISTKDTTFYKQSNDNSVCGSQKHSAHPHTQQQQQHTHTHTHKFFSLCSSDSAQTLDSTS